MPNIEFIKKNIIDLTVAIVVCWVVGFVFVWAWYWLGKFIIKYGQIGIKLPFLAQLFKPTPPLVPASTVLLMVVILLVLPQGLFGRKE